MNLFRLRRRALVSCLVLASACRGATEPMFGETYALAMDPLPSLDGASLTVTLSYRGCSAGDTFVLEHRKRGSATEVWLRKPEVENCGAFFREARTFVLPDAIAAAAPLYLLSPNNNPYLLRS